MSNKSDTLPINAILSSVSGHVLHLYTPNVNKYAVQMPFLAMTQKGEEVVYVTNEDPGSVMQELKQLDIELSVIRPEDMGKIHADKLRIVIDAGSIDVKDHLKREDHLAEIGKKASILCLYDVAKLSPETIKQLVAHHDNLILTTDDVTVLSSESLAEAEIADKSVERFVKDYLDMIVLSLLVKEPMCGTDIIKTIHKNFNVLLSPGTIYPLLHTLEEKGLLKCEYNIKKKTYKPTEKGEEDIRDILKEHLQASRFLNRFLQSTRSK